MLNSAPQVASSPQVTPPPDSATGNKPLEGVFHVLAQQHREATRLLRRLSSAQDRSQVDPLWETLRNALLSHERSELSTVYAEMEQHGMMKELTERHRQQVVTLSDALQGIDTGTFGTRAWHEGLANLSAVLDQHIAEEETMFFPEAQAALGTEVAQALELRYLDTQVALWSLP